MPDSGKSFNIVIGVGAAPRIGEKVNMKKEGQVHLKVRENKSKIPDVPPSLEFSIVRSERQVGSRTPRPKHIGFLGTLNGWLTNPSFTITAYKDTVQRHNIRNSMRVLRLMMTRPTTLKNFHKQMSDKINVLLGKGIITAAEKEKLIRQLDQKLLFTGLEH